MSEFIIRHAVRTNTPAFIAFAGATGTGKTRSALELATGLAGATGKILVADSEGQRALHYADLYNFDHVEWTPPFTPESNAELINLAESKGYAVLVIDSESDEMEGEGGLQEIAQTTKDEFWARTKARHKHSLINRMRRSKIHIIFCLRCEERVRIEKVFDERRQRDVTAVIPIGWAPICEKRFMHEVQSSFMFKPGAPGVPEPMKLYDIHAPFFPEGKMVTREAGRLLAEWAAGGESVVVATTPLPELEDAGRYEAAKGNDALDAWFLGLSAANRNAVKSVGATLREIAHTADAAKVGMGTEAA